MNGLNVTVDREKEEKISVLNFIGVFLWSAGFIKMIFSAFPTISNQWWMYALGACVIIGIFSKLFRTRYRQWILPAAGVFCLLLILLGRKAVMNGFGILGNDLFKTMTGKTGTIYLSYPVHGGQGAYLLVTICLLILILLLCRGLMRKQLLVYNLLTAVCFLGCMTGLCISDDGMLLLIAGLLLLYSGKYDRTGKIGSFLLSCGAMVLLLAVCAVPALLATKGLQKSSSYEREFLRWSSGIHKMLYDHGTDAMPEGNLSNVDVFDKSEEIALQLTMEKPQKLYLRGMTGERYTGISWEGFDEESNQEGENLFYWLHKNQFFGQTILADAESLRSEAEVQTLCITTENACKDHWYLPYGLKDQEVLSDTWIGDNRTKAMSDRMEVSFFSGSVPQWYELALWLSENQKNPNVTEYLKKEESYREYVYEQDLQLTNTTVGVFENLLQDDKTERSLSEILNLVIDTLDKTLTYDEHIMTGNGKNDFVKYTLEQSRRGYSVHYATIATLMLRYMGVPARYVEGYFLPGEEAASYQPGETISLTERHAHAWTEYYMDGVGWIPFEVTPGYRDEEEWNAAGQIIADGMGDESGKGFTQSSLTYTPPKLPETDTDLPNLNSTFRFEVKQLFTFFRIMLLIFILWGINRIFKRFLRKKRFAKYLQTLDTRGYVIELYSYAMMLNGRYQLFSEEQYLSEKHMNEIARFSEHELGEEHRSNMDAFLEKTIAACRSKCSIRRKLIDRYILWIF